ncbi:hypothetical protein BH09PSE5_BH09PSE5_50130 [soil metagenome]
MPSVQHDRQVTATQRVHVYLVAVAIAAAVLPASLAHNLPPSSTFFNQAVALLGWGMFAAVVGITLIARSLDSLASNTTPSAIAPATSSSGLVSLVIALAIVMASAAASTIFGSLPASLSMSAIGMILAALILIWAGASARATGLGTQVFKALCIAMVVAGLVSVVIALIQVFAPSLADGSFISRSEPGRAAGNLRQPNHLGSLVVWSAIAAIWLFQAQVIRRGTTAVLLLLFVFTVALSASRTAVLEIVALAIWGALDRRLPRSARLMLVLAPVFYVVAWLGLAEWAKLGQQVYAGTARLQQDDISSSRFAIWSNAIEMIRMQPWLGTGFGEFNLAWTMTSFPQRPVEYFDHPHNLILHLATELGVPLAAAVTTLLCWALWRVFVASRQGEPLLQGATRAAFVMIVTIAIHSQLEYPLWYAYFLLPTALVFGLALGPTPQERSAKDKAQRPTKPSRASGGVLTIAGVLVAVAAIASMVDYNRVVVIFAPPSKAGPLMDRIADGRHSWFFSHHADYALATTESDPPPDLSAFKDAIHYLLDVRLLQAWAEAYARRGDIERASTIASRMREFRNPDLAPFFEVCNAANASAPAASAPSTPRAVTRTLRPAAPFQCQAPEGLLTWRDFR